MVMITYHYMFPDTRNKNIYAPWVGISTVFKILEHLWFKNDITIPYGQNQLTTKCSMTQGTMIPYNWGFFSAGANFYLSPE
jgi:hypothetical protein